MQVSAITLSYPAEPDSKAVAADITHSGQRAWRHHTDTAQEVLALLAGFHSSERCYVGCQGASYQQSPLTGAED